MRYAGLDLGRKTLGIALSDPSGIIAQAYTTYVFSEGDYQEPAAKVVALIKEQNIGTIVLGLPKNMDGSVGFQARESENFADLLKAMTTVPIILWDERLTTRMAQHTMTSVKTKTKQKKHKVDQLAASILLQSYLDMKRGR
jgi:putative Holliday junction resolvase